MPAASRPPSSLACASAAASAPPRQLFKLETYTPPDWAAAIPEVCLHGAACLSLAASASVALISPPMP